MSPLQVTITDDPGTNVRKVDIPTGWVTLLVAIVAIVPPLVQGGCNYVLQGSQRAASTELDLARLDLERRREAAALYRTVLANADPAERRRSLAFLLAAGLIEDSEELRNYPREDIPHWPAAP